jgi:AAA domain
MRIAVSGSHGTGKSRLIAAFLERCPGYAHEPEAYEALADDIELPSNGPTPEGLQALLDYTITAVDLRGAGVSVIFERSPADYVAYAIAAARSVWSKDALVSFIAESLPRVRKSVRRLDLIVFLPVSAEVEARFGEGRRYRRRVDDAMRRILIDDDHGLFDGSPPPTVIELGTRPSDQLSQLVNLATAGLEIPGRRRGVG